jgi:hypothetical protein
MRLPSPVIVAASPRHFVANVPENKRICGFPGAIADCVHRLPMRLNKKAANTKLSHATRRRSA